jgi:hypothetical protein
MKMKTANRVQAWAWLDNSGEIDLDSISEDIEGVRINKLESHMGWRFQYPERYSQDDKWEYLLRLFGRVVPVDVTVVEMVEKENK